MPRKLSKKKSIKKKQFKKKNSKKKSENKKNLPKRDKYPNRLRQEADIILYEKMNKKFSKFHKKHSDEVILYADTICKKCKKCKKNIDLFLNTYGLHDSCDYGIMTKCKKCNPIIKKILKEI